MSKLFWQPSAGTLGDDRTSSFGAASQLSAIVSSSETGTSEP